MTRFGPDHERWADAVGSFLLGSMPDDELGGFEEHLSECPACRDEVERLRVAADALPVSVPLVPPPPALKDRIMTVVEAEAELLASADPVARPARREAKPRARAPQLVRLAVAPGRRARLRARAAGRRRRGRRADRRRRRARRARCPPRRRRAPRST